MFNYDLNLRGMSNIQFEHNKTVVTNRQINLFCIKCEVEFHSQSNKFYLKQG